VSRFLGAAGGIGQVTDFLPVTGINDKTTGSISDELLRQTLQVEGKTEVKSAPGIKARAKGWPWLVRRVEAVRGSIKFRLRCQPAFDYGRISHRIEDGKTKKSFISDAMTLELSAHPLSLGEGAKEAKWKVIDKQVTYPETGQTVQLPMLEGTFELGEHQAIIFLLRQPLDEEEACPSAETLQRLLHNTNDYWHRWLSSCTYRGRWREIVNRSALVLKLMTFAPTGAIIAAPTTSLPETLGGDKNWDYRFTWIRDAAFTVYAFLRIGLTEEAADFMTWIESRCREVADSDPAGLRLMYDIRGFHPTVKVDAKGADNSILAGELILEHWTGYKDSRPVRIGNLAAFQHQLDIYGELLDAIYLCDKWVRPISYDFWKIIRDKIVPHVLRRWNDPDHGIWEGRGAPEHHVYSKVMAWVALDRAIRLSQKRSLPGLIPTWMAARDKIHTSVMDGGYNDALGVFTQYYGGPTLDASNLIMPLVFFLPPDDPRFLSTLERTLLPPKLGGLTVNHLVFRFNRQSDDLEGTFTICSFWLVEALARAGKRNPKFLTESRLMFEDIIGYANHLGLFSEEIGLDGSALGNFPQAFTHLSLISAAFNLDRTLG
jgi:GH15 family glucan-1,4-alpha-glucosidase